MGSQYCGIFNNSASHCFMAKLKSHGQAAIVNNLLTKRRPKSKLISLYFIWASEWIKRLSVAYQTVEEKLWLVVLYKERETFGWEVGNTFGSPSNIISHEQQKNPITTCLHCTNLSLALWFLWNPFHFLFLFTLRFISLSHPLPLYFSLSLSPFFFLFISMNFSITTNEVLYQQF